MAIEILYFARLREIIGRDGERVQPPAGVTTVGALADWLSTLSADHAEALTDRGRLRAAVDQTFAQPDVSIAGAREIAFFPPVTGG
jgi:sulfur-carrier protein